MDALWSEYLLTKVGLEKEKYTHHKTSWVLLAPLFSQNAFSVFFSLVCSSHHECKSVSQWRIKAWDVRPPNLGL